MKKILILILSMSLSVFALDLSNNSSSDSSSKSEKSTNLSAGENQSEDKSKSKEETLSKEKSLSYSNDLTKLSQTSSYIALLALEQSNIKPFSTCRVLSKPKLMSDFNLDCKFEGFVNSGRCSFLSNAAESNMLVEEALGDTQSVKKYTACLALYGALIAQDLKHTKFSVKLTDKELIETYQKLLNSLNESECRFSSKTQINCDSATLNIAAEPTLNFANIALYSEGKYFGYSANDSKKLSSSQSKSQRLSKSDRKSIANNLSSTISTNASLATNLQEQASANLSLGKFIPGE